MADFSDKLVEIRSQISEKKKKREKKVSMRKAKFLGEKASEKIFEKNFGIKKCFDRVKSGVPGIDEVLHGGIPEGNLVVIAGGPGSGKTSFGLQFLYEGAKNQGEPGVFISLEEEPERLIKNAKGLGFDFEPLIKEGKVLIIKSAMYQLNTLFSNIKEVVRKMKAKRLVIDPGALLRLFFETEIEVRKAFVDLAGLLKKMDITPLITTDFSLEAGKQFEMEEYAADGVILLYHTRIGNIYQRMIAILKMRGTSHSEKVHPFKIGYGGIMVYPEEEVFREME